MITKRSAFKLLAACAFTLLPLSSRGDQPRSEAPRSVSKITIGGFPLIYRKYKDSVPGRFLFSLYDASVSYGRVGPAKATLAILESNGTPLFQRAFVDKLEPVIIGDLQAVEPGLYGYFVSTEHGQDWPSTFHFLDARFRDVFPREVPNDDQELNEHAMLRLRNGHYLFLFYRTRIQDALIDAEIQERDADGKKSFTWNSRDWIAPPGDGDPTMDYLHLNSMDQDADGGLLLSFAETSEIVKISYPEGKILWRMSYRDWKFLGDPLQGFRHQHSVTRLGNGNLLLFDNGGYGREEISRAVEYRVDAKAKTATLVWEYRAKPGNPFRATGGTAQRLSNGNTLIGWGGTANGYSYNKGQPLLLFTEVDPSGETVRELVSVDDEVSYRVFFEAREQTTPEPTGR